MFNLKEFYCSQQCLAFHIVRNRTFTGIFVAYFSARIVKMLQCLSQEQRVNLKLQNYSPKQGVFDNYISVKAIKCGLAVAGGRADMMACKLNG